MTTDAEYRKNLVTGRTYVSKALNYQHSDGTPVEKRYIRKVFDVADFREFIKDAKTKKIVEVIHETQSQEVLAIVEQDTRKYSLSIQRFNKQTGTPIGQSFSFWGGALPRLLTFLSSLGWMDLTDKKFFKINDADLDKQYQTLLDNKSLIEKIESLTTDELKDVIVKIGGRRDLMDGLSSMDEDDVKNLYAATRQTSYKKAMRDIETLLNLDQDGNIVELVQADATLTDYVAGQPEKIFQNWIERNLWVFGVEYSKKHDWRIIGESEADLVMESPDGFVDLIEVKRPRPGYRLFNLDTHHNSYYPAAELSQAIGQCMLYLRRLDEHKATIEEEHSTKILRSRIKLIIGRGEDFNEGEIAAMRMLNRTLNFIEVITYDDLIRNGEQLISYYETS
jgi:hypothetical protein